jgi:hypothetical protein
MIELGVRTMAVDMHKSGAAVGIVAAQDGLLWLLSEADGRLRCG